MWDACSFYLMKENLRKRFRYVMVVFLHQLEIKIFRVQIGKTFTSRKSLVCLYQVLKMSVKSRSCCCLWFVTLPFCVINHIMLQGRTLLHWACDRGHVKIVKYLLDQGFEVNRKDVDLSTPLHYGKHTECADCFCAEFKVRIAYENEIV